MTARRSGSGTSPWIWVGCGCALLAFVVAAALIGGGFWVVGQGRDLVETMSDPAARDVKAAEILGAEALPEGYRSIVALELPFFLKMVIMGDQLQVELDEAPPEDADFDTKAESMENLVLRGDDVDGRLFVYVRMRGRTDESIEGIFSGREKVKISQADLNLDFDIEEVLGEGSFEDDGATIDWTAKRGSVDMARDAVPSVWATLDVTCPSGDRPMALWLERIAAPSTEGETTETLENSSTDGDWTSAAPADPSAIEDFVRQLDLCA